MIYTRRETAEKAILLFSKTIKKKYDPNKNYAVTFYGGEPLLNFDIIEYSLNLMDKLKKIDKFPHHIRYFFITNGIPLNKSMIEVLKKYNVTLVISLDGFKELNDQMRVYPSGKGSYEDIMKAIRLAKTNEFPVQVSCVVGKHNVDFLPEICKWIIEDLGIKRIGFNHASVVENRVDFDIDFETKYADKILECQPIVQKNHAFERRVSSIVDLFNKKEVLKAGCTGCGEQLAIDTKGNIGVCQGFVGDENIFSARNVHDDEFDVGTDDMFIRWNKRIPYNIDACISCPAIGICGGGCPRNAYSIHKDIFKVDSAFCIFAKKTLEWIIENEISKAY